MENITMNWTSLYPGVEHAAGANAQYPANDVNILRIDLSNPKIAFLTTPWSSLNPEGVKTTEF